MREIKFRGKRISDNTWIYGRRLAQYFLSEQTEIVISDCTEEGGDIIYREAKIFPYTLCQYTGLEDKNDTPIYEGDIVESVSWNEFFSTDNGEILKALRRPMLVVFHEGAFCMMEDYHDSTIPPNYWDLRSNSNFSVSGDLEVIGNVFDNPELLK